MNAKLFYDTSKPSAFSTLAKLQAAIEKQTDGKSVPLAKTRAWLERQGAYMLGNIFPEIHILSLM
jgi:hypothetical protein